MNMYVTNETVAQYLAKKIKQSGKTQSEICAQIGYTKPNIITMFKQGKTKVPLDKVGLIANALDIDGFELFRRVLSEYMPETLAAITPFIDDRVRSHQEHILLESYRAACGDNPQSYVLFNPRWLKQGSMKSHKES